MRIFPFHLGLSFTFLSAFLLWQASPPAQAQTGNQSDVTGAIVTTSDISGGAFTHSQPGGRGVAHFSSFTVQTVVNQAAITVLKQLNINSLTSPTGTSISPETQQRLLLILTASKSVPEKASFAQIITALSSDQGGSTASEARQLAASLEGLFKTRSTTATSPKVSINANRLLAAIKAYNQLVNHSSAQFLNNPPPELVGIRSVLSELIKAVS